MDADGYIFIYDRVKDMIVTGGENVYPAEVENAIFGHPHVADVAVIGVPDEQQEAAFGGEAQSFEMHFCHQRTSRVDDGQAALARLEEKKGSASSAFSVTVRSFCCSAFSSSHFSWNRRRGPKRPATCWRKLCSSFF